MAKFRSLFFAALFLTGGALKADSLWPGGQANAGNTSNMMTDRRALKIGDLVTVRIVEQATAEQHSNLSTNKQASISGGAGLGSWTKGSMPVSSYGAGGQENFDGGGSSSRGGRILTTLTARVINMLDSGNLVIEGRRSLKINDEKQHIYVRGVIRPADVGRDNTVLSSAISDAQIMYEGKGVISEKSRPGFFTRLLDWLWIF
ncbi:MAG: flagellar basal body L-ring protein FlgH [candidate division FCPU426 bacterium]